MGVKSFTGVENTDTNAIFAVKTRVWLITQNHPERYGVDATMDAIKEELATEIVSGRVTCIACIREQSLTVDDAGEHTPHIHLVIYYPDQSRMAALKKHFPHAALQPCDGSVESVIQYIRKDTSGEWYKHSPEKLSEKLPDAEADYWCWDARGKQSGKSISAQAVVAAIRSGATDDQIISTYPPLWRNIPQLQQLRTTIYGEKYLHQYRQMQVMYVSGPTGVGKTRGIMLDTDYKAYTVDDYTHPWDGYTVEDTVVLDEFRSQIPLRDMLRWLDGNPCKLPARYAQRIACYTTVYIVSNWELEELYKDDQSNHKEDWAAFLRRVHCRRVYEASGKYTDYTQQRAGEWVAVLPTNCTHTPLSIKSI